jgi:hypothetical protein
MRSLALKLTLAFLLVGLTGAVLVAVFVRYRTQREFDRLVLDQNQQALVTNLTRYYQATGYWRDLEAALRSQQDDASPFRGPNPPGIVRRGDRRVSTRPVNRNLRATGQSWRGISRNPLPAGPFAIGGRTGPRREASTLRVRDDPVSRIVRR